MEDQRNILKKGLEKPSVDFTKNLMQSIEAEEKSLSRIIKDHGEVQPSVNFKEDLMSQLAGMSPKKPYEPVISKRIWIGIAAILAVVFTVVFATSGAAPKSEKFSISLEKIDFSFIENLDSNPMLTYTICGVLLLSIALLAEQRLKQKREN